MQVFNDMSEFKFKSTLKQVLGKNGGKMRATALVDGDVNEFVEQFKPQLQKIAHEKVYYLVLERVID